jgi:L-threonylcarbamoyladenylate synthase
MSAIGIEEMEAAVSALQANQVIGMPTETVYGLAGLAESEESIRRIFTTKQRPFFDPLIVHVSSSSMAKTVTSDWSPLANFLAEHFWPGPLTLVLPKASSVHSMITSGLDTVGIRMPRHSVALSLIDRLGKPLVAPSANLFGKTSPTTADHVRHEFKDILVLDGGPCELGLESTVLKLSRDGQNYTLSILRPGAVSKAELEKSLLGQRLPFKFIEEASKHLAPGQMKHHYMPETPLVMVKNSKSEFEILAETQKRISSLPHEIDGVQIVKPANFLKAQEIQLPQDPILAARLLYAKLREPKQSDILYFRLKPEHATEPWIAIMDRLTKAASLTIE